MLLLISAGAGASSASSSIAYGTSEEQAKRLEKLYPNAQVVVKSADSISFRPPGYKWERALMEAVNPALADIQSGKSPVRKTMQDAVRQANAILAGG